MRSWLLKSRCMVVALLVWFLGGWSLFLSPKISSAEKLSIVPEGMPAKYFFASGLNFKTLEDIKNAKIKSKFKGKWKIIVAGDSTTAAPEILTKLKTTMCGDNTDVLAVPEVESKYMWFIQDYFQSVVQSPSKTILLNVPHGDVEKGKKIVKQIVDTLKTELDIEQSLSTSEDTDSGNYGGNLDSFGPNFVLLGSSASPALRAELNEKIAGLSSVAPGTDWLHVGHLDEWISLAKSSPTTTCPRVLTVADPKLGSELLANFTANGASSSYDSTFDINLTTHGQHCWKYTNYAFWIAMGSHDSNYGDPVPAERTAKEVFDRIHNTPCQAQLGQELVACAAGLKMMQKCFNKINLTLKEKIDQELEKILAVLPPICSRADIKIVRVPTFYINAAKQINETLEEYIKSDSSLTSPTNGLSLTKKLSLISLWPNSTNSVVLNEGHLLVPKPGIKSIEDKIKEVYDAADIKPHFIETRSFHAKQGNIHCLTNTIR